MPEAFSPGATAAPAQVGTLSHRGRPVSLIDLRTLLDTACDTPATDVLIVDGGDYRVGFMIDSACHVEYMDAPADSLVVRWRGEQDGDTPPIEQCKRMITVGSGAHLRVLSVLCLETLAALLIGRKADSGCPLIGQEAPRAQQGA